MTVVTDKGAPVPDLTAADFEVKVDGKSRAVLQLEPMTEPLSVALLLDDRGSDINEIRSALAAFAARVQGRAEVSLVSVVPTALTVFDYTSSMPAMIAGIRRLVWRAGPAGGLILGAVADAADALARREVARPAIVVVTFEGEEFRSHRPARTILAAIERSGATLHVVAVGTPTLRKLNRAVVESGDAQGDDWTVDQANRNAVLAEGPRQSGGRRLELAVATGLTKALDAVADDLLHQYALVYAATTDGKPSTKLSVSVKRRDVVVRAPTTSRADRTKRVQDVELGRGHGQLRLAQSFWRPRVRHRRRGLGTVVKDEDDGPAFGSSRRRQTHRRSGRNDDRRPPRAPDHESVRRLEAGLPRQRVPGLGARV